jgi:hypothetical protein
MANDVNYVFSTDTVGAAKFMTRIALTTATATYNITVKDTRANKTSELYTLSLESLGPNANASGGLLQQVEVSTKGAMASSTVTMSTVLLSPISVLDATSSFTWTTDAVTLGTPTISMITPTVTMVVSDSPFPTGVPPATVVKQTVVA